MPIYKMNSDRIDAIPSITFADAGIAERTDLQRLLRDQIEIIAPGTLVIGEEFGDFEGSNRSIDLLAVDTDANLVVIELKRTEDGGHMELQAIRYAAMVSTMTFEQAVLHFGRYLQKREDDRDALDTMLEFLSWGEPDEDSFANEVKIILASADFSQEITSSVLWLNEFGLDIRCVRLRPYGTKHDLFLDVQQVIPLPEASDYQVRVREKQQVERVARKQKQGRPWNGRDFYVSLSEGETSPHRNWDDCREFGFIGACGGPFYIKTLYHLHVGARVFVNIPKTGYVGIGMVAEAVKPVTEFTVKQDGRMVPILEAKGLRAPEYGANADDPEICEHYVRVDWLKTVPREQAHWEKGLFAVQHSACKLRDTFTIESLCGHFGVPAEVD